MGVSLTGYILVLVLLCTTSIPSPQSLYDFALMHLADLLLLAVEDLKKRENCKGVALTIQYLQSSRK